MKQLLDSAMVQKALAFIHDDDAWTFQEQLTMTQIPAPSHQELKKATYVMKKFQEIGLENVHMDEVWNVFGTIKGTGNGPTIMLAGHTDTVFPIETDLTVKVENGRYNCPGINDDTRAVAELMTIARAMQDSGLRTKGDIVFCANVCEEGLGDLKGVKYIFSRENCYDAFVSIDNPATGGIVYTATGSLRYRVTFHGQGGHSFADFGIPNPNHALCRAVAAFADLQVPRLPKTTFNVGVIHGGTSVNTISAEISMLVDMRSDSPEELKRMESFLKNSVKKACREETERWTQGDPITADFELVGVRPAGTQCETCAIVQAAWKAAELLGIQPELRDESSTDANIPISLGIPAITIGRGGNEGRVHTIHEWFEPVEAWLGPQKDLLCILALAGVDNLIEPVIEKRTDRSHVWKESRNS